MLIVYTLVSIILSVSPTMALSMKAGVTSKMKLKYFNARGAAETCRILLAIGGEEYDDIRYDWTPGTMKSQAFADAKASGELKINLNRAPVLVVDDGVSIGQSKAIERFLAKRFGLMGNSPVEEALIDCVAEHCRDVRDAAMRKGFSAFARGKTDEEKRVAREEWFTADLPTMLGNINDAVKETSQSKGFAVGSSLSLADVAIWSMLSDCQDSDKEDTAKASVNCDALNAIVSSVSSHAKVAEWLVKRPKSMF
jgi:glutathione S-transferase